MVRCYFINHKWVFRCSATTPEKVDNAFCKCILFAVCGIFVLFMCLSVHSWLIWSHMFVAMYLHLFSIFRWNLQGSSLRLLLILIPIPSLCCSICELFTITEFQRIEHVILERLLKTFTFKICHVHSIFRLVSVFSIVCMVILVIVGRHTVCTV